MSDKKSDKKDIKSNQTNVKLEFSAIASNDTLPLPIEVASKKKDGAVLFGEDNRYPQYLFSLYSECSMLQSLCNGTSDYIYGNTEGREDEELLRKLILDYVIFGAFAVQVRRNKYGKIVAYDWVDVQRVRLDEDGKFVYYSKDWNRYAKDIRRYERWSDTKAYENAIFYYKNPMGRGLYGLPMYSSAITEVQTLIEISTFHLSSIRNGLHSPMIINFNNGTPTDEVKRQIEDSLKSKFSGSKNSGKFMVAFNQSKDNAVDVVGLPDENYDSKYMTLKENSTNSLLVAFRASAQLFGVSTQATGFSSIEYKESYALFSATVVTPMQRQIEKGLAKIGIDVEFQPFDVDFAPTNNNEEVAI